MEAENCSISAIVDIVIAVGTLLLAILAIWGERVRSWSSPPKLQIEPHNDFRGDANILTDQAGNQAGKGLYFHLKVVNKRPWLPVKNCKVLLMGMSRRGPDNEFHSLPLVVPSQLVWAPKSFSPVLVTITKDRILDLGNILEGDDAFRPALYSTPNNFQGFVKKNEAVRYELAVEADNFISTRNTVLEVAWDGRWEFEPEKMENHLRIREIHAL